MNGKQAATAVWITWESQPRNRSMSRELGVPLHELAFSGSRLSRQWRSIRATLRVLRRERPDVVFASNPSLVLTFVLLACRAWFGYRFVSDAHYGGVVAVNGGATVQRLLDFANARVDRVIVTTDGHAQMIRAAGGDPFVCPDPLPVLPAASARPAGLRDVDRSILFICSFDKDEPFAEVFEAAKLLVPDGFRVFVSGRFARIGLTAAAVPHVTLLGYVDRETYDAYLLNVDLVLDLTTWEDCLVCGAYEAMVAEKPCVLSRSAALTGLFTDGTVFTSHAPEDIAHAVREAYDRRAELRATIPDWLRRHGEATRARAAALRSAVGLPPLAPGSRA